MKKKILVTVFFSLLLSSSFAQHYRVGAGFTAGLPNDYVNLSGGFDLFVEYKTESPFSFRTGGGFAITKFKDANPYIKDIGYSLYWLEGSLMYFPVQSEYEPYIGGGISYYFVAHEELNEIKTLTESYTPQELNDNFSFHLKAGFIYPLNNSIKLNMYGKYLLLEKDMIVKGEEFIDGEIINSASEIKVDLSTFFISAGLIIKI